MASELELAGLLAGLADNPSGAELIAAQWKHAAAAEREGDKGFHFSSRERSAYCVE